MKSLVRGILLVAGLALFGWFVWRAGPGEIWRTCATLGVYAPLALVPYALVYASDTLGWRSSFPGRAGDRVGFLRLYRIRWCGEAVNNVVPSAYIGGEALKVYLLRKCGVGAGDAGASVIIGRTVQTLTQVIFIALGAWAFFSLSEPGSGIRTGMLVVLAGSTAAAALLFWLQWRGLFTCLFAALGFLGLRPRGLERRRDSLLGVDHQVTGFYRREPGRFLLSGCGYLGGWLLDTTDIWLVSWLLHMPVSWPQALAIEAFVGVAKILGLFVPGALGVQESGIALVCRLAGLPDALGLSYAILRRGREVVYAALGWLLLYLGESGLDSLSAKLSEPTPPAT